MLIIFSGTLSFIYLYISLTETDKLRHDRGYQEILNLEPLIEGLVFDVDFIKATFGFAFMAYAAQKIIPYLKSFIPKNKVYKIIYKE